ncbi:MAG: ABC transporter permease [Candidatus Latescibacterota bacterium]|nr:MAG: ABC transporter permease [Candidatus Latescibacterota bacterium]
MRFVWTTALKDWRRHRRNPIEAAIWIGIPLLVGFLIALAFGGQGGHTPQAHVLVADEDNSFLSQLLVGALSQEAAGGFIRAEEVEQDVGRLRMDKGDATAMLVIPEGFSQAVLLEEPVALQLLTNPSQRILPGMVEESLSILADGTFYLHRLMGEDLRTIAQGPPPGATVFGDAAVAALSVRVNQLTQRLGEYLSPPLIQLETSIDEDQEEDDEITFGFLLLPTILFMALLFIAQGLSEDIWQERTRKTLRRVVVSPQHILAFLVGKIMSGAGIVFAVCLVALCVGYAYLSLSVTTLPLALVWATLSGAMLMTGMLTIQLFATSQRAGNILTMAIMFPLMMVGGSFFPFEAMPKWMAAIGTKTPNGWALQHFKGIVLQQTDPGSLGLAFLGLLGVSTVLFLVCAWRLRRGFAQG